MKVQRILIALDDDPLAVHAAAVGSDLAQALGAKIAFVYVIEPPSEIGAGTGLPPDQAIEIAREAAHDRIAAVRRDPPDPAHIEFMPAGIAADEIVKAAREWPADIVVIGSHGRGGLQRVVQGSVAEAVMRRAPCPVLVVKAPEADAPANPPA